MKSIFSLLTIFLTVTLIGQNFTYSPSKFNHKEGSSNEGSIDVSTTVYNKTGAEMTNWTWKLINLDIPNEWSALSVCDNINCYFNMDEGMNKVMASVPSDSSFYFKVSFFPNNVSDSGSVSIVFWDDEAREPIYDTIGFSLKTTTQTSVEEFYSASINLYPNPVSDILNIDLNEYTDASVSIYNFIGQTIWQNQFSGQERIQVNCADLAKGTYFIKIETKSGVITRKVNKK